jgi:hypothetical protein
MGPQEIRFPRVFLSRWPKARRVGVFAGLAVVALIPVVSRALLQNTLPNTPRNLPEFLNRPPDLGDQERMRQEHLDQQNYNAANALRQKQVADESAKLLKLANDLKTEMDATDKDTVSKNTLHKAEEIEKLARNIKQKMSISVIPQ